MEGRGVRRPLCRGERGCLPCNKAPGAAARQPCGASPPVPLAQRRVRPWSRTAVPRGCPGAAALLPVPVPRRGTAAAPGPVRAPRRPRGSGCPDPHVPRPAHACASCSIYSCQGCSSAFPVPRGWGTGSAAFVPSLGGSGGQALAPLLPRQDPSPGGWQLCPARREAGRILAAWAGAEMQQRERPSPALARGTDPALQQLGCCGAGMGRGAAVMLTGSAGGWSRAAAPRDGVGGPGSPSAPGLGAKVGLAGSVWGCPGLTP